MSAHARFEERQVNALTASAIVPNSVEPVLRAESLTKQYGLATVLSEVSLDVLPGEIQAIIGENGAGKSTLMRILSGYVEPTEGAIWMEGRRLSFIRPSEAQEAGIALVHQEILLADGLTVMENLFLGRVLGRWGIVDDRRMRRLAAEKLAEIGCTVSPNAIVGAIPLADKQMVQIARALLDEHKVVIFDEPTTVLTGEEVRRLHEIIVGLKSRGIAVLYISHRLDEVQRLADRVTVLRDGKLIGSYAGRTLSQMDMARLMVGRELAALYPEKPSAPPGKPILSVRNAHVPGHVEDVSFTLRKGEILGFAGMIGAGRTELFEGLIGLRPARASVELAGKTVHFRSPRAALDAGIGYLTEDRKGKGLLLQERLAPNLTLSALARIHPGLYLRGSREAAAIKEAVQKYDIRVKSYRARAGELSGGNQQKLLLAKVMMTDPSVVIIDEPTRGIDIANKAQIYAFIRALVTEGKACIVISSDMQELIGVCDRILVMRKGRITGEASGDRMTEHEIAFLATSELAGPDGAGDLNVTILADLAPTRRIREFNLTWSDVGPFLALAALLVIGFAINREFLSATNLANVITRSAFTAIIGVGATFVISSGGLDLSVGSMAAFITGVTIMFMNRLAPDFVGWAIPAGMAMAVLAGLLCGLANGLIVTVGRIEPFIATLGTMGIFRALITYLSDGGTIPIARSLRDLYRPVYFGTVAGIPIPILISLAVAALGAFILYKTKYGRECSAVGANEDVARYSGISVVRTRTLAYVIQGICVAIAAICYVPQLGAATPTTGLLWELQVITAVVIGGTALRGGKGHIWGTIAGAVILELIANLMVISDFVSEYLVAAVQGAIIIIAMLIQRFSK